MATAHSESHDADVLRAARALATARLIRAHADEARRYYAEALADVTSLLEAQR